MMPSPDTGRYFEILTAQAAAGNVSAAEATAETIFELGTREIFQHVVLPEIVLAKAIAGDFEGAREIVGNITGDSEKLAACAVERF